MEEIKVGEYIRTKSGYVLKVEEYHTIFNMCDDDKTYIDMYDGIFSEEILKYSFNIIDLIEVGDYVNGKQITRIIPPDICGDEVLENARIFTDTKEIYESDIKSIVTKEMMEKMEYKVGD